MATAPNKCPICDTCSNPRIVPSYHNILHYKDCQCGEYFIHSAHRNLVDLSAKHRLAALLYERFLKQLPAPLIHIDNIQISESLTFAPAISIDSLLATWPETVMARLDRILCNLTNKMPKAGEYKQINTGGPDKYLFFSEDNVEGGYYLDSLKDLSYVEPVPLMNSISTIRVTPKGWARAAELEGGASRRNNPAFVAMWFGGMAASDQKRMTDRFELIIQPACKTNGWIAERVDTKEHNNSIMDRIVAMMRVAPFVIADLDQNNDGVYYEAGFARGRGVEVIYLVKEGSPTHFDVSGVNHVRWSTDEELRQRLENRILGTMGRGPNRPV